MGVRYAEIADLQAMAMVARAIEDIQPADKNRMLDGASDEASSFLRGRFNLPLTRWDSSITQHVANIAAYRCMSREGFNPNAGANEIIRLNYEDALKWLRDVQGGRATPDVDDTPLPTPDPGPGPGGLATGSGPVVLQPRETACGVVFSTPSPRWLSRG